MEFGLFSVFLGLVSLVAFIWLVVIAFRENLIWGFLVFLFSPLSAIAFAIYHWEEAKKPFLVYLTVMLIFSVMLFSAFRKMGGLETIETTHRTIKQLEKGEISEAEASKRVADQMQNNIEHMAAAGVIGSDERKLLEQKVQKLKLDDADSPPVKVSNNDHREVKKTAAPSSLSTTTTPPVAKSERPDAVSPSAANTEPTKQKAADKAPEFGPGWSLEKAVEAKQQKFKQQQLDLPVPRLEGKYVPVPVSQAEKYVGQQVRIVRAKTQNDGRLKAVNDNYLVLDMQVSGGQADYEIKRTQIYSMYVSIKPEPMPGRK